MMVAIVVVASTAGYFLIDRVVDERTDLGPNFNVMRLEENPQEQTVELYFASGSPQKAEDVKVTVYIDGQEHEVDLDQLGMLDAEGVLRPGARGCLVGVGCPFLEAQRVQASFVVAGKLMQVTESWVKFFSIQPSGAILAHCAGQVDMLVVGVDITKGKNGPPIPVYVKYTRDAGGTLLDIFSGQNVTGGMSYTEQVHAGALLGVVGYADGLGYYSERYSYIADDHVAVLEDGDDPPEHAPFGDQTSLEDYLAPYVQAGKITLAANEVIILYEFTNNLNSEAADFQDLVVLFSFPAAGCTS